MSVRVFISFSVPIAYLSDNIIIPLIQKTKAKRKYTAKSKKDSISSIAKPKLKKETSLKETKLTKVIKENDDFLTESQHKLEPAVISGWKLSPIQSAEITE